VLLMRDDEKSRMDFRHGRRRVLPWPERRGRRHCSVGRLDRSRMAWRHRLWSGHDLRYEARESTDQGGLDDNACAGGNFRRNDYRTCLPFEPSRMATRCCRSGRCLLRSASWLPDRPPPTETDSVCTPVVTKPTAKRECAEFIVAWGNSLRNALEADPSLRSG